MSISVIGSQNTSFADVVSLDSDYVAGQADIVDKLNDDRHGLTDGVNNVRGVFSGSVQSSGQIKARTVGEENMAEDANPRIRTAEGASCIDLVYTGLLPPTSSTLVLNIPVGVAYPEGYRVEKTSSTAATLTASKWTYYYILSTGSFSTNEVAIGAATPSAPANSATLFRASTDGTTINTITDLRRTSCAQGPFSAIADVVGEATLADLFGHGVDNRRFGPAGRAPGGYVRGLWVSLDTTTTQFKVTNGSAYINGKYRFISADVTVPSTEDNPSTSTPGADGLPLVSDTTYYVYATADQSESPALSITYSTSATAPTGVTNYRLIGKIGTDSNTRFASQNSVATVHAYQDRETVGGWIKFDGASVVIQILNGYNVSSITDHGTADYTITWDRDFDNADYAFVCSDKQNSIDNFPLTCGVRGKPSNPAVGSVRIESGIDSNGNLINTEQTHAIAVGDSQK